MWGRPETPQKAEPWGPVALIGSSHSVMDSASPCDLSLDGTGKTDVAYTE